MLCASAVAGCWKQRIGGPGHDIDPWHGTCGAPAHSAANLQAPLDHGLPHRDRETGAQLGVFVGGDRRPSLCRQRSAVAAQRKCWRGLIRGIRRPPAAHGFAPLFACPLAVAPPRRRRRSASTVIAAHLASLTALWTAGVTAPGLHDIISGPRLQAPPPPFPSPFPSTASTLPVFLENKTLRLFSQEPKNTKPRGRLRPLVSNPRTSCSTQKPSIQKRHINPQIEAFLPRSLQSRQDVFQSPQLVCYLPSALSPARFAHGSSTSLTVLPPGCTTRSQEPVAQPIPEEHRTRSKRSKGPTSLQEPVNL